MPVTCLRCGALRCGPRRYLVRPRAVVGGLGEDGLEGIRVLALGREISIYFF